MTPQVKHGLLCLAAIALCVCVKVNAQVIVSVQDGDWSSPTTWSTGIVPVSDNSSQITIDHQVTVTSGSTLSIDDVTVNGLLTIGSGATVTIANGSTPGDVNIGATGALQVYGRLICSYDAALMGTTSANTVFFDDSYYQHQTYTEGVVPKAQWYANSTFELIGLQVDTPFMTSDNWSQPFGNFVYNCPEQDTFVDFNAKLSNIQGDFRILSTNGRILRFARGHDIVLSIGGDLVVEGNSEVYFGETHNSTAEISIEGDFIFRPSSGGSSYLAQRGISNFYIDGDFLINAAPKLKLSVEDEGQTTIFLGGNFVFSSGTIDANVSGRGNIIFNGTEPQFFLRSPGTTMDGNLHFAVEQNAVVDFGQSLFSNATSGDLTVEGVLRVGSINPTGVFQAGPSGNVNISGVINFFPGSVLEFNGTEMQFLNSMEFPDATLKINNTNGVQLIDNIHFRDVIIERGSLDVGNFTCHTSGDIILLDGDVIGEGALVLSGDTDQTVEGNSNYIQNLTIDKSADSDILIESPLRLTGLLSFLSSNTDVISNGGLSLVSTDETPSGTASIGTLPPGSSIEGSVNVQRYMAGIGDKYRYVSSPITAATVQSLKDAVPVTGTFADPTTGPGINSTAPSLFEYDETINQWKPFPASGLAVNNFFEAGKGYCYFNWNNTTATIWNVTGEINQGDFDFDLSFTDDGEDLDGWNLVGNPYPCAIRWDIGGGWERNNSVSMGIAVRDNALGGFRYWDGLGVGNLPDGRIALGQSFWVRATGSNPLLTIHESAKVVTGASFYRPGNSPDYVELEVKMKGWSDKTFLRLREHASDLLDNFDIPKMANDNLSLSLMTDDSVSVAINAVQQIPCHLEIPLNVVMTKATSGDITFSINAFGAFNGSDFHLFNESTGEKIKLAAEGLTIKVPDAVKAVAGLKLIIDSPVPEALELSAPSFFVCEGGSIEIPLASFQEGISYRLFSDGLEMKANDNGIFNIRGSLLNDGKNLFTLEASSACSTLVRTEPITIHKMVINPPEVLSGQVCRGEPAQLMANSAYSFARHHWYEASDDSTTIHIGSDFITPPLMKSKTYFVSTLDSLGCESRRVPAVAEVVSYDSAIIMLKDGEMVSNYPDGNQWLFNGIEIPNETNQTIIPHEPGVYTLEVRVGPCRLTDQFEYVITEVASESKATGIMVYPQPCSERIFIRFHVEVSVELTDIFSSSGISVYNLCTFACDNEICEMNTTHLPKGLYIIRFSIGKDPYFVRFIKQ